MSIINTNKSSENRLRFAHRDYIYPTREEFIKDVVDNPFYAYEEYPALYAEPMVFRYGSEANPNIVLAIGSVGEGIENDEKNRIFYIDFAHLDEIVGGIQLNADDIKNLSGILNALISACGVNKEGTYEASDNELLNEAKSLFEADETLARAVQENYNELKEILDGLDPKYKLNVVDTNTIDLGLTGTTLSANVKVSESRRVGNVVVFNDIQELEDGLFHNVYLDYDKDNRKLTFYVNGEEVESFVLDGKFVSGGTYDYENECLVFKYNNDEEFKINLRELIDEWTVVNEASNGVILTKERDNYTDEHGHHKLDALSAKIQLSSANGNLLQLEQDGLYASNSAADIKLTGGTTSVQEAIDNVVKASISSDDNNIIVKHADGGLFADVNVDYNKLTNTLILSKSNGESKEIELNSFSFLEEVFYDGKTETIVIKYKSNANSEKELETRIPVSDLFTEYSGSTTNTVVVSADHVVDGQTLIQADVRVAEGRNFDDNILEVTDNGLYVKGTAEQIKYGEGTVESALTGLTQQLTEENSRATNAENELSGNIETLDTKLSTTANTLSDAIVEERNRATTVENDLNSTITGETAAREDADTILQGNIESEQTRAEGVEGRIITVLGGDNFEKVYDEGSVHYITGETVNIREALKTLDNELYNHVGDGDTSVSGLRNDLNTLSGKTDEFIKNIVETVGVYPDGSGNDDGIRHENRKYTGNNVRKDIFDLDQALYELSGDTEAEVSRATEEEGKLNDRIDNLGTSLEAEVSRATEEEGKLHGRIDTLETNLSTTATTLYNKVDVNQTKLDNVIKGLGFNEESGEIKLYGANEVKYAEGDTIRDKIKNLDAAIVEVSGKTSTADSKLEEKIIDVESNSIVTIEKVIPNDPQSEVFVKYIVRQGGNSLDNSSVESYVSTIEIPKHRFLEDVRPSEDNQRLVFTFVLADGSTTTTTIDFTSMVTESEFGNGLQVSGGTVSIKLSENSETQKYLRFTNEKELELYDIDKAIQDAVEAESKRSSNAEAKLDTDVQYVSGVTKNLLDELGANKDGSIDAYDPQEVMYLKNTTNVREDLIALDHAITSVNAEINNTITGITEDIKTVSGSTINNERTIAMVNEGLMAQIDILENADAKEQKAREEADKNIWQIIGCNEEGTYPQYNYETYIEDGKSIHDNIEILDKTIVSVKNEITGGSERSIKDVADSFDVFQKAYTEWKNNVDWDIRDFDISMRDVDDLKVDMSNAQRNISTLTSETASIKDQLFTIEAGENSLVTVTPRVASNGGKVVTINSSNQIATKDDVNNVKSTLLGNDENGNTDTIKGLKKYVDNNKPQGQHAIAVNGNVISLVINNEGDNYLTQDENGLKLLGISSKFNEIDNKVNNLPHYQFDSTNSIKFTTGSSQNILAEVKRKIVDDNLLQITDEGLYVAPSTLSYNEVSNTLTFNGKDIQLSAGSIVDDIKYTSGEIVIEFTTAQGERKEVSFDASEMFQPITANGTYGIDLTISEGDAASGQHISAQLVKSPQANNMLEITSEGLLVNDSRVSTLESRMATAEESVSANNINIVQLQDGLNSLDGRVTTNTNSINTLNSTTTNIGLQIEGLTSKTNSLETTVNEHTNKFDTVEERLDTLTIQDETLDGKISVLNGRVDNLKESVDGENGLVAVAAKHGTRISVLETQVNNTLSGVTNLNTDLATLKSELKGELGAEVTRAMKAESDLSERVLALEGEIKDIKQNIADLKKELGTDLDARIKSVVFGLIGTNSGLKVSNDQIGVNAGSSIDIDDGRVEVRLANTQIRQFLKVNTNHNGGKDGLDFADDPVLDCGSAD